MAVIITSSDTPDQVQAALSRAGLSAESVESTGPKDPATEPVKEPEAKTETPAPSETEKPAEDGKTADVTETPETKDQEQPRDESGKFKPKDDSKDGYQRRIDKLVAKQRDAERKAEDLQKKLEDAEKKLAQLQESAPAKEKAAEPTKSEPAKVEPAPKPKLDDFPSYEDWVEALTDWKADQKALKAEQKALKEVEDLRSELKKQEEARSAAEKAADEQAPIIEAFNDRIKQTKQKYQDYDEVMQGAADLKIPKNLEGVLDTFIMRESEIGPAVAYWLAKNPDEFERIVSLSPVKVIRELGKIEEGILAESAEKATPPPAKAPEQQKPKLSSAPPPISPVSGNAGASTKDPSKMTLREYEEFLATPEGIAWRRNRK